MSVKMSEHPLYKTWCSMNTRCYNPKHITFKNYGAMGVKVCDKWRYNFWEFVKDMKKRPSSKHQLDRINNDGDYNLKNCRWVLAKRNCRNKSTNLLITHNGETLCATEWSERLGLHRGAVATRIRKGWDKILAVTTPKNFNKDRTYKPHHK